LLALVAGVASSVQAQRAWQTEIGIQGGFTRAVAAGVGADPIDAFSLPGFNLGPALPLASGLYAIIPWSNKLAVNLDFALSQLSGGTTLTLAQIGARGDYALTPKVYAGAGGAIGYFNSSGTSETQLGVQGAVGYRLNLSSTLRGRIEAVATFWGNTENAPATNTYSVLFGVGTSPRRSTAAAPARRGQVGRSLWTPQIGVSAGYASIHPIGGGGDITALAFPTFGSGLGTLQPGLTTPPTIFAIFPIGRKIAIEPGVDIHRTQSSGTTTFSGNLSARLNYAVHGGWYAAAGGNLNYIKVTGVDAATVTGANVAWGYRFPSLWGSLGGRVELNYTMFGDNADLGLPPTNTVGLMFSMLVPLK
jgi:hypothetical protein